MTEIFETQIDEVSQDAMPLLPVENAGDASGPPTSHRPFLINDEEAEADAELERDTAQEDAEAAPITPKADDARTFFNAIFPDTGLVSVRTLFEGGRQGSPSNHIYELGPAFPDTLASFLEWTALEERSAFVIPGLVRPHPGGCKDGDVIGMPAVVADIDTGDTLAKLAEIEALIGPATVVVESGGQTEHGPKIHVWYKLTELACGEDIAKVCAVQAAIAKRFGCDSHFGHPAQVIRLAASWHRKKEPKLVRIREVRQTAYPLTELAAKLCVTDKPVIRANDNYFDFSNEKIARDLGAIRDMEVLTEGRSDLTRWEWFNLVAGAEIADARAGRKSVDEALQYIRGKVLSHFEKPEDWDNGRIDREFAALVRVDERNHGTIAPQGARAPSSPLKIKDWSMRRYEGAAPVQRWLVEGTFPLGEPGILAGDGGVGKSFLALDLCLRIATGKAVPPGALDFGRTEIFGGPVVEFGSAVFITAEESKEALHRRLAELDPHNTRHQKPDNLFVVSLRDRSGPRTLIKSQRENYAISDFARELAAELKSEFKDLRLVVLDPVSALFGDNMNDRGAVQALADVLSWIASETGATVIGLHHRRKDGDDGRKSILGSSGFVDAFRFAYILQLADKKDARKYAPEFGLSDEHGEIVIGELVKANGGPKGGEHIYERQPSGVLRQLPSRVDLAMATREARLVLLVDAVDWYAEYGQPFTKTSRAGSSGISEHRACLPEGLRGLSARELQALVEEAIKRKDLVTAAAGGEKKQQWLCRPGSNVAMGNLRAFTPGARPPWETRTAA